MGVIIKRREGGRVGGGQWETFYVQFDFKRLIRTEKVSSNGGKGKKRRKGNCD